MANFAETLTYWYLRLNGFFPLSNFVLHRYETESGRRANADADLLAVRFKHVSEDVGGQEDDWDPWFEDNQLLLDSKIIGLIVEVKSGDFDSQAIERAFSEARIEYAMQRLGFYSKNYLPNRVRRLHQEAIVSGTHYQVAKLLITGQTRHHSFQSNSFLTLSIQEMQRFIELRMEKYSDEKNAARFFFPDEIIQFFAWQAGRGNRSAR